MVNTGSAGKLVGSAIPVATPSARLLHSAVLLGAVLLWALSQVISPGGAHGAEPVPDETEVDEVAADLAEAGLPPTATELAELLAATAEPAFAGGLVARSGWTGDGRDQTVRLRFLGAGIDVKGRWRQDRAGVREAAGALLFSRGGAHVGGGTLTLHQGFGVLLGGAGRSSSLTADGGLAAGTRGIRAWTGSGGPQTLRGGFAAWESGRWSARFVGGQRGEGALAGGKTAAGQMILRGAAWEAAVGVVADPGETGGSLAGRTRHGALEASWEFAGRRPAGPGVWIGSGLVAVGWRPVRDLAGEVLVGWADLGPRPVLGRKHPVFGDWAGQGAALRGTWRAAVGLTLKVLAQRSQGRADSAAGQRSLDQLGEVLISRTGPGPWRGECRWRSSTAEIRTWSERFPWQPAVVSRFDRRRILAVRAGWQTGGREVTVAWRRLAAERITAGVGQESGGVRSLVGLTGAAVLGRLGGSAVRLRAGWTIAWGDPVDLVSAAIPYRGMVVSRHWGHWRAEQVVGLDFERGALAVRGALSRREPAAEAEASVLAPPAAWSAWAEAGWSW